ncbi:HNH endonuclease [Natronosporangium hydrolyticum]|uniref:HNH endonuclease n=1 Tax=Natronosporangium hydrolyticum TaxID=2811111 RepID=A0A895YFP0_9ACTN|nr:HNH endonuclease [Natronosporangium hydrolyticum]QSB16684.1 HNH endonuclease [Natronosporangium hydrolyticum]
MRAYVGVTDGEWYRYLAERPTLDEVNFWRPSGARRFRSLHPGEPFFFKTHYPHNRVVGGGFYSGFVALPVSEAWELYGESNGVSSLAALRRQIAQYRRTPIEPWEDPVIGCVLIRDTRFFEPDYPSDPPPDFAPNLVQGRRYDLAEHPAVEYFSGLITRLLGVRIELDYSEPWHLPGPTYGDPRLAPQRLGQRAFQAVVLDAYARRCAITGSRIRPVLQAAHVLPLPRGGQHRLDNGLLLRSDIHTLYDRGYLGVDPKHRLLVSPRLRSDFGNGEQLYRIAGEPIAVPERPADRPNREFLERHLDEVYLTS